MDNLLSNVTFCNTFDSRRNKIAFLIDTDVLSDIAKNNESKKVFDELLSKEIVLFYSLPSLLELGFGADDRVVEEEFRFCIELQNKVHEADSILNIQNLGSSSGDVYANILLQTSYHKIKGKLINISPGYLNWMGAKQTLIEYMKDRNTKSKNIKRFQIDALINHHAWNATAFIWTNNMKDHLILNYFMMKYSSKTELNVNTDKYIAKKFSPVFNTEILLKVLKGDTINMYDEMKKYTNDEDVIRVLNIAKNL
ncbi:hypothetical protein JMF89_05500 [Clostridiaceae bacterium UIB06]|uniref:Uncharacterized protein n=1 Tax=Clostridium thailandense TaxID=2794346 RepID=A0A949X5D5_9CLOT|nr:hypothetical protein [Clostridium thailandense]MBV7275463.1 hypothetical protein [Clostridium thailandense]MCH5136675.1 hypothetical protein [Clostridiaceae bacterium UIB06]